MTTDLAPKTVTIQQAAALAGVSRRTIYNWLQAGKLRYKRTAGGGVRIDAASLWQDAERRTEDGTDAR